MSKKRELQLRREFERERLKNKLVPPGPKDFVLVLDSLKPNFNVGKLFRTAEAFGCREIHLIGIEYFLLGPAKGSFKHVPARFHSDFSTVYPVLKEQGYEMFTMEPEKGSFVHETKLPKKSAFILGHEEYGISFKIEDFPEVKALRIPQIGKVQSLNVSVAGSIVMYEYLRQQILSPVSL